MKKVDVTITFTVPTFYTFDETAAVVSEIMVAVKALRNEAFKDADAVSVVVDEDDDEE